MEAHARAGIDINGSVLRYAEVERFGSRYRLLRLGSCDFDFDVSAALWQDDQASHLETVSEALADVFTGATASSFQVTLHPPETYAFFTPLPAGISDAARKVRLQQEAFLLAGVDVPLRLTADEVETAVLPDGEEVQRVHVLAVPEAVHNRFDRMLRRLSPSRYRLMLSMQAAASSIGALLRQEEAALPETAPYSLAIGWYPSHVEYSLCRDDQWIGSHFTEAGSEVDVAYFTIAWLQRLGIRPGQVSRLYHYGTDLRADATPLFERLFPCRPERLNPLAIVDLDPDSLNPDFDVEAYVPCMGAAL